MSEEEDTAEDFHQDESETDSSIYDRAKLEAVALAATPECLTLCENAKIHLDKRFPSANGNAANTELTPLFPELENMSNSGKPKLLDEVPGVFTTQICDPDTGIWADGPEIDIQRTVMKVDKVRMSSYESRGWHINWSCSTKFPQLPSKCWIEIDRDQPTTGIGIFHYRRLKLNGRNITTKSNMAKTALRRFEVRLLRTVFIGPRGQFSCFSYKMRVPMQLKEAIDTPSPLINREMNCDSEEGSHIIRRSVFRPADFVQEPIDVEIAADGGPTPEVSANTPGALASRPLSQVSQPRIAIQGGVKGFLTLQGFNILDAWKAAVTKIMNIAAEAQRKATAIHMFPGLDQFAARRNFDEAVLRNADIDWVQLSEEQGNQFRQDLPNYLFLGQEFITKEARGCRHFDLARASANIEDDSIEILQILPQDLVETVLNTEGFRACAKEMGWHDNKLLFELAGSDNSGPNMCAGLKGYSMVFDSKNASEFGWSLAAPTGQYLQAAAEGELSLRKDVAKGMWILGGCPARWPALCVGQHMVIVPGKKARRCAAHGSPKAKVLEAWALRNNHFHEVPAFLKEYWDLTNLRSYVYPGSSVGVLPKAYRAKRGKSKLTDKQRLLQSGMFDKCDGIVMPTIPEVPATETPVQTQSAADDGRCVTKISLETTKAVRSKTFTGKLPSSHLGKHRLTLAHMEAARSEHEDFTADLTNPIEVTEDSSAAVQSITNDAGELLRDNRQVAGVLITAPPPRPPPPVSDSYLMPPRSYNENAIRNTEGRRLAGPTDPDMQLPDKSSIGIQITILLAMGAEPCIDVADIESYFRNFSIPLYRQGTQATSIPFGPHGFGVHKRGEFGKYDMPACTTPAGIFICRATEFEMRAQQNNMPTNEYPDELWQAMASRTALLGNQHGHSIYSCIWIDDLLIMYHQCPTLQNASKQWLTTRMEHKLGFTCAREKQQLWETNSLRAPPLKHRLNSFGAVTDYVGLRMHIPRPIPGESSRQLPVWTVQEPKLLKYADKLATLYRTDPATGSHILKLLTTLELQKITGQIVAAAATEIELLELCRPFWHAGLKVLASTAPGRRGPILDNMHSITPEVRRAAETIENRMRFPTPLPAAPRVHYPHVRSPGVHLVFSDARKPGKDMMDPANRAGEEFCFGWWCDLGPIEGVVYFQRHFTETELLMGIPVLEYIGTYCAVMSTYAYWAALPHSDAAGHGHLIAMTDSKTVKQRFKGGKVRGTPMMQTHSLFIDALESQDQAARDEARRPLTVDVCYFSRDFNLMSDSLTHGRRGIPDFKQLAAINGFTKVREATTVPAISAAAIKYGNMTWDEMLTHDKL